MSHAPAPILSEADRLQAAGFAEAADLLRRTWRENMTLKAALQSVTLSQGPRVVDTYEAK